MNTKTKDAAILKNNLASVESLLEKEGFYIFSNDESLTPQKESAERRLAVQRIQTRYVVTEQAEKMPGGEPGIAVYNADPERPMISTTDYLKWHMDRISNVIGREEIIRQAMFAILTRNTCCFEPHRHGKIIASRTTFSTPSTACACSPRRRQEQTPDNYFGPCVEEFKREEYATTFTAR